MTNDYGNLELHQVLLAAMKDIDKICRENGLRYYLYAGTLLGAMNYQGFIPWDDDIDLVMFPEDYEKFSQILNTYYSEFYEICSFSNSTAWFSKMNKLYVKGTEIKYQHDTKNTPIFIDISVLHNVPDHKIQRVIQRKIIEIINLILSVQAGIVIPTSLFSKLSIGLLANINRDFWGECLDYIMKKYDKKSTKYVGIMCNTLTCNPYTGKNGYENDITLRSAHETPIDIVFEDTKLMTFANPEIDMVARYGPNWSEPYPKEKRITKHDVKTYEISPEVRKRFGL